MERQQTRIRISWLILISTFLPCIGLSQSQIGAIGIPTDATMFAIPGVGSINLNNGNLHMEIPLRTVLDRNGRTVTTNLVYDSNVFVEIQALYQRSPAIYYPAWAALLGYNPYGNSPASNEWYSGLRVVSSPNSGGTVSWTENNIQAGTTCGGSSGNTYSNWQYVDGHGTVHPFNPSATTGDSQLYTCGYPPGFQAPATDGSGLWLVVSNETSATIYDVHGNTVYPAAKDTNGNSGTGDELGRPLGQLPGWSSTYTTIYVWTKFGTGEEIGQGAYYQTPTIGAIAESVLSSLTRPDGRSYSFEYDDAGPPQGTNGQFLPTQQGHYGDLTGITLPTGGHIGIQSVATSSGRFLTSIQTPDGTWNLSIPSAGSFVVTAPVDPHTGQASQTTFSSTVNNGVTSRIVSTYSGAASGTPLRSVNTQFINLGQPTSIVTTQNGTTSSTVLYTYPDACTPRIGSKKEYDFSGALIRETDTAFYTSSSDNTELCSYGTPTFSDVYLQNGHHIADIPTTVTVYGSSGSSGTPVAQTAYTYDSTSLSTASGSLGNSVLGLSVHDDANFGSSMKVRGNPTVIQQLTIPGTLVTTRTIYYNILGEAVTAVDANGNATNLDYTDSWNDSSCLPSEVFAYPTTLTNALNQVTKTKYNSCDGSTYSIANQNDINANRTGTTTTYDELQRPVSVSYPDGGSTSLSYGGSAVPEVDTSQVAINSSESSQSYTTLDSLGRKLISQLPSGAYVGFGYDVFGRVCAQSNPTTTLVPPAGLSCTSSGNSSLLNAATDGITYFGYDALGRTISVTQPDGSSQALQYTGATTTFTDEAGNQWSRTSNALGQLVTVLEPNGSGQSPAMDTDYGYDALGNLLSVTQWGGARGSSGARTRTFSYDGLSRLVQSSNPETGTVCYGTLSGSTCSEGYDGNGNLLYKTDARGVVTNYRYDALNRLFSKSYTNAPAGSLSSCYGFDTATGGVGSLSFEWTGTCTTTPPSSPPSSYQSLRVFGAYDALGRPLTEQQCVAGYCTSSSMPAQPVAHCTSLTNVNGLQYCYDLSGNLLAYGNGVTTGAAGSYPQMVMAFSQTFDAAGRLATVNSSWNDATHPPSLLSQTSYSPENALTNWLLGGNLYTARNYDNRSRVCSQLSQQQRQATAPACGQ